MKRVFSIIVSLLLVSALSAQTRVSGTVTSSDDGLPIPYANIQVKGVKAIGTTTGVDGKFFLEKISPNAVLVISFLGYTTQEISVEGKTTINIVLKPDALNLDEVMVVAYGTAKKGTYTGSAAVVKSDAIKDIPSTSFEGMLQGKVAGLKWSPGSGQAGSSVSMRIRGTGSMNATNEPLFVIDGVPVIQGNISNLSNVSLNVMSTLNPSDIESFTVLKDAAASSLYGSRAANGVVLITTKKGKQGKTKITFKGNYGFTPTFAYNNWELPTNEQQREIYHDVYYNQKIDIGLTPTEAEAYAQSVMTTNIPMDPRGWFDWEKALFRTATFQNYDLSASGADEKGSFFSSIAYSNEEGRVYTNAMERYTGRINVTRKLTDRVELISNINLASIKKDGFNDSYNNNTNYFLNTRNQLFGEYWPTAADGTPVTSRYKSYAYNNLYYDQLMENYSKMFRTGINETVKINILPELILSTVFGYDVTRVDDHTYYSPLHNQGSASVGSVTEISNKVSKLVSSTTLAYSKEFNQKNSFSALIGAEVETNNTDYVYARGTNLPNSFSNTISTAGATTSAGYSWGHNMASLLSKADYSYDNKYYLSGSIRTDGSSKLGESKRWGTFWSLAASWRAKEELFLKDVEWLSNLKVKASYGVNGTLPTPNYGHLALYTYGYKYMDSPGGIVSTVADPNLSWETSYTYNIGVESSFLDGRVNMNLDYFDRDSRDLIQAVQLSRVTGFSQVVTNFGAMNNKGLEVEITGDIIRKKDLTLTAGINASFINSKVTKLYGGADITWYDPTGGDNQAQFIFREGKSPLSFWGKEWAGVDPQTGKGMWYMNNTNTGDAVFNGKQVTYNASFASNVITGCADPDVFGGIFAALKWKGLSVDMTFSYSLGGDIYNAFERYINDDGYFSNRTRAAKVVNRWKNPGDITDVPRYTYEASYSFFSHTSRWLYKNNYIRLKDLSISYNIPSNLVNKFKLSNARIFASGTNLWTKASQNYFDPEGNVYGVQSWQLPIGKTITFGIELGF